MKETITICLLVAIIGMSSFRRKQVNIHPLEPAKNHYASLKKLSDGKNLERAELDEVVFPASDYSSGTLIYTLMAPHYLTIKQAEELKTSMQYPANSSDQTKAELEYLLEWEKKRSKEQTDRAVNVLARIGYWPHIDLLTTHHRYNENLDHLLYEGRTVMGKHVTVKNYPATTHLLRGVTKDMRLMEFKVKYHLLRPRPYHLESKLNPLARISSPSFASGHTLWAYIQAFTWSELIPQKRKSFLDVAYEVGESREIMGIHYPSDEEAARVLAHKMLVAMCNNPEFIRDLDAAKKEWK